MAKIMLIDDDSEMRSLVHDHLTSLRHDVKSFASPTMALAEFLSEKFLPDLVLTDLQMPEMNGNEVVKRLKAKNADIPVIVMTAFGSIESAVDSMKKGAFDYFTKPFKLAELSIVVERALNVSQLAQQNSTLRAEIKKNFTRGRLVGKSKPMLELFDLLERIAPAVSSVLISGESGSGKEVIARTLHEMSPRSKHSFVAINCTAIPETLLESELFGHSKGAFTGADRRKIGLFEEANGGTLFLDEIGDMPLSLQAKLLRALQERQIRPVGETKPIDLDVRVITATHKDLKKLIQEGLFRDDLFYRLNVIPVHVPALRHRKEDIPLLAQTFLQKYAAMNHSPVRGFTAVAMHLMMERSWPGNVRELENLIERLVVLHRKEMFDETDLPASDATPVEEFYGQIHQDLPSLESLEKRYIEYVLTKTGGKKDRASHILGINRRTLYRKEREYGWVNDETDEGMGEIE